MHATVHLHFPGLMPLDLLAYVTVSCYGILTTFRRNSVSIFMEQFEDNTIHRINSPFYSAVFKILFMKCPYSFGDCFTARFH
jgi:hypothetical protein